jgi:RNA-directed DNA polymerase
VLRIRSAGQLAAEMGISAAEMWRLLRRADDLYREMILLDPAMPGKERPIVDAVGPLKVLQRRLYQHVLLPGIERSPFSNGGVPGRDILKNVLPHCKNSFIYKVDISSFYPSIHRNRVARLFVELGCSREVSEACARLCTYRHHLAQGLVTSPILADFALREVDKRIGTLCGQNGLAFSRFVDDATISGPFDLARSGIPAVVRGVFEASGFELNEDKTVFERRDHGVVVTGLRFSKGHPDVPADYFDSVVQQIHDAGRLSRGELTTGPFLTQSQIWGRVQFICWVNPGRKRSLLPLMSKVDWKNHAGAALKQGLIALKKRTVSRAMSSGSPG